jgi:hypothetical protein
VMRRGHTVPRFGGLPELIMFSCPSCHHVETREIMRAA